MVKLPFGKKTKFVLKARKDGKWEDLGEFETKVSLLDVRDVIDSALDDGYDAFRLEEVTEDGKRVRIAWTKYYKSKRNSKEDDEIKDTVKSVVKSSVDTVASVLSTAVSSLATTFVDAIKKMKEMEVEKPDIATIIAEYLYAEELLRKLAQRYAQSSGSHEDEFERVMRFLMLLNPNMAKQLPITSPVTNPESPPPPPPPPLTPPPSNTNVSVNELTEIRKKAEELAKSIVEEARSNVANEIAPCKALGECLEEEVKE